MNYLAHIYLSDEDDHIKIGNFMADAVKGNHYDQYSVGIQVGIKLHRFIDSFTDSHPVYRQSKHRLHEKYGHYAGVIMDIIYDHFLAKNWSQFSTIELEDYADNFYNLLQTNYEILTEKTQNSLPYMIDNNWLVSYKSLAGLELILFQMDYRTHNRVNMPNAMEDLKKYYVEIENEFFIFFNELQEKSKLELEKLRIEFSYPKN
ncbi:acyl carrier protein phosphodiesterase [Flavobacterium urocaniciphilum]|uniref:Acyl carrier protein phosphodiesterase n=1 Tax=Flavobacterium urocaniciphilum TaxID=1299341 RepID=A0A1H8Z604_9FLAO|nr:acyl carrier protein phosphodiesterase [Flavobacterium urocaniciphilum]SEP59895.1 Acyl carrier protein phosphodiesterase [Flavobacterium urocaniciphilum]